MEEQHSQPPCFTEHEAAELVGKYILIGVRYFNSKGEQLKSDQMHGVVSSASPHGVQVSLRGTRSGENFSLPPDPRFFETASPGKYTLRSTGEVIENPEVLCNSSVTQGQRH
jgi:hypothetical protein